MYLFTENKNYKIEIFAGYITTSESDIYNFPKNSSTNENLIKTAMKKSTFKSEIEVSNEDRIITLSTCSYDFENARYVILGVLKEIDNK
jgi:sortase B